MKALELQCFGCGEMKSGGVIGEFGYFCWKDECQAKCRQASRGHEEKVKEDLRRNNQCLFDIAWVGYCKQKTDGGDICTGHQKERCHCGRQAVSQCDATGMLVCGTPLCGECTCRIHAGMCQCPGCIRSAQKEE